MTIRPRVPQDLPACVRELASVHRADGYPTWWPDDPVQWLSPTGSLDPVAWVAEVDGGVVGHVCVVTGVDDPVMAAWAGVPVEQLATVSRLFVGPAGRGRGLGAALLAASVEYAAAHRFTLMLDVVDDGGAAVALYDRLGWQLMERRLADWTGPEGDRPWLRMYLAPPAGAHRLPGRPVVEDPLEQV